MAGRGGARRIHEGLVGERRLVGTPYLADPELRDAYAAEIAPRTEAALARIFAQVFPARTGVGRALDLGAGTGAGRAAVRAHFGPETEVVAVDRVPGPGVLVADVTRAVPPAGVEGPFDLIIAAHLLNELRLDVERRARLVAAWCHDLLVDGGTCVIVDPALRETSRALLAVRDLLVTRGLCVVAPCLWQGACPALSRERDFCHDSAGVLVSGRSRVDFSYLVLRTSGVAPHDQRLFRVVSDRMVEKGRARTFGCGPAGRHALVRLDRDRTAENQAFDEVERGQVIAVDGAREAGDGLRIGTATRVERQRG